MDINTTKKEWFGAARNGHDERVAELLITLPVLIDTTDSAGMTALHHAAERGHEQIVTRLLLQAAKYDLRTINHRGETVLHCAAKMGHERVFSQLLAACPDLIDMVCDDGSTVLHCAAGNGHDSLVAQILALRPQMATMERSRWTPLECALEGGHQRVAERLLAAKPELANHISGFHRTTLHRATAAAKCDDKFVAKLWQMNPKALRQINAYDRTPFYCAIMKKRNDLIELFQWHLSLDEIELAFSRYHISYQDRYRPVMERLCAQLWECLHQDVVATVFEYLGFEPAKRARNQGQDNNNQSINQNMCFLPCTPLPLERHIQSSSCDALTS